MSRVRDAAASRRPTPRRLLPRPPTGTPPQDLDKRIARLVVAVETASDVVALVDKLRVLQTRRTALETEAAALRPVPRLAPAVIETRLAEWRRLLRASTTQGRTVLQRILRGRLTFTPHVNWVSGEVDGYDFEGPTRFDKLFTGMAVERPAGVDEGPLGSEGIGPEDTFDGDYGRLLEQVYVKGVSSPPGHVDTYYEVPLVGDNRSAA